MLTVFPPPALQSELQKIMDMIDTDDSSVTDQESSVRQLDLVQYVSWI
jgi:hypothetical protein